MDDANLQPTRTSSRHAVHRTFPAQLYPSNWIWSYQNWYETPKDGLLLPMSLLWFVWVSLPHFTQKLECSRTHIFLFELPSQMSFYKRCFSHSTVADEDQFEFRHLLGLFLLFWMSSNRSTYHFANELSVHAAKLWIDGAETLGIQTCSRDGLWLGCARWVKPARRTAAEFFEKSRKKIFSLCTIPICTSLPRRKILKLRFVATGRLLLRRRRYCCRCWARTATFFLTQMQILADAYVKQRSSRRR